jgi:head-tail adaptor
MRAGDFRERVTIEQQTEVSDGHDGFTESWGPVRTRVAAQILPLAGRELEQARLIDPRAAHEVKIRYWTGSNDTRIPGLRFIWHHGFTNRTLTPIEPFREVEPRQTLVVFAREAV